MAKMLHETNPGKNMSRMGQRAGRGHRHLALTAALLVSLLLVVATVRSLAAADISVCPAGPPTCDYATIQAGLAAAGPGDRVLVGPGAYLGPIDLKSDVELSSTAGSGVTFIRAPNGPVVSAGNVTSATLRGFTIRGQGEMTRAVGIASADSQLAVARTIVETIYGRDDIPVGQGSADAVGIQASGSGVLSLTHVVVRDVYGGSGGDYLQEEATAVGDAVGVDASGTLSLTIAHSEIYHVLGGDAAFSEANCSSGAAETTGVRSRGSVALAVRDSHVRELASGLCGPVFEWCPGFAVGGRLVGLDVSGEQLLVVASHINDLYIRGSRGSARGIVTQGVATTELRDNTITNLPAGAGAFSSQAPQASQAPCPLGGSYVAGVEVAGGDTLIASHNTISHLRAGPETSDGRQGRSVGLDARQLATASLTGNHIAGLRGRAADVDGLWLEEVATLEITGNRIGSLRDDGDSSSFWDTAGGTATGVHVTGSDNLRVENNIIYDVAGGDANLAAAGGPGIGRPGGDGLGLRVMNSNGQIHHNTIIGTEAGRGDGAGLPGQAVGLTLFNSAGTVHYNALILHEVGIAVDGPQEPDLSHQGLWDNGANFDGTGGGLFNIFADPALQDVDDLAGEGWRLTAASPFVDADPFNAGTIRDFEGDSRPLDGDGDGDAWPDIGVDEYWPGLSGSIKSSQPLAVQPGGQISYTITLVNGSQNLDLSGVLVTDTLPALTTLVSDTLTASGGQVAHLDNQVTWSGNVAAGGQVVIRFAVTVDPLPRRGVALVNEAILDDRLGHPRLVRALNYINPYRQALPLIAHQ